MSGDGDDFLSRWSRRKRAEGEVPETQPVAATVPETVEEDETEEQTLARLGLPDPDSLGEGDDFTRFLKAGVPDLIRRRALRRLWRTNPVFAHIDGLQEYGENYADPNLSPETVATAYKVGQGFVKKVADLLEDASEDEVTPVAEESVTPASARPPEPEIAALGDDATEPEAPAPSDETAAVSEETPRPRRMRFDHT